MTSREFIKLLVPPLLVRGCRSLLNRRKINYYGLSGNYRNWDEAICDSTGYDSKIILEKTKASLLKVKNGQAAYERDSVLFDKIQCSWSLLAGLMWVAAQAKGKLNVLDFGGSLGSTYFQNRAFLHRLPDVRWNIVEQPGHVETGKRLFEDEHLKFYASLEDCLAETRPNVVLISSVLQYIERPYNILHELLSLSCDNIIIDRTPFRDEPTDMLCVQNVPPNVYSASYPSWIFSMQQFHSHLSGKWKVIAEFDNPDKIKGPIDFAYKGMIITRRTALLQNPSG